MSKRFRKKPVEIEAIQLDDLNAGEIVGWIKAGGGDAFMRGGHRGGSIGGSIYIETLEGRHRADVGDWIICGVKGEFYPCKPDIFDATYDPVSP